jgi:spermidine synthase
MSSLFTDSEIALAELGVAAAEGEELDVVVGGLGLGYTARAVLEAERVGRLTVVEYLAPVIAWHQEGLLPLGPELTADPRCRFLEGDFFALAASEEGFDPATAGHDAILLDIDHSPDALLDDRSQSFYRPEGLAGLARHLKPGGVFGLWSNDRPDDRFSDRLAEVFATARAEPVAFHNPLQDREVVQTVYLART